MKKFVIILYVLVSLNILLTYYLFIEINRNKSDIASIEYNIEKIDFDYLEKIQPKDEIQSDCYSGGWLSQVSCDN